ncbi:MarR family transcriptional regulator [Zobellella taiwanensis]|jgi:DNA-binding MarR family transcriptional regulator|uniref:MarR family transcriptional regulator n=1 Tax=Zobellella taiwanensis TaxID=347535 RepID=A0A2P7R494_9GAMM|nr:MarR family transcriptional regulator [Zobellella taiwanensis]PSJ45011.1 MarR family transcriptional regulator [Zobellella taiwanensis]
MAEKKIHFELDDFVPYKLMRVAELVGTGLAAFYREEFGISRPEWRLLAAIGHREQVIARELAELTCMDKVKVSRGLQGLEQKGLIARRPLPEDQRAALVCLTPAGQDLYQRMVPRVLEWEARLIDCLSASEYRDMVNGLDRLITRLDEL